jgi:hypothetical protein
MKRRVVFFILSAVIVSSGLYAQPQHSIEGWGDAEAAQRYVDWVQQAIDEERWDEALTAIERAADFANVSSDISYLLAVARSRNGKGGISVVEALDMALETNHWVSYSENHALLLKAEQLVAMREYLNALSVLEQTVESADAAKLRLLAFRGLALGNAPDYDHVQALTRFRSLLLNAMDRYPRDTWPVRIFFEYARNRNPQPSDLAASDINLLELVLRRLPFLLEADPELAWVAAPFIRNTEDARRLVASYRSGGLTNREDFRPGGGSIPPALNLGLISDSDAVEEMFAGAAETDDPVIYKDLIIDVYNFLRGEEGRELLTQRLLSYTGFILCDDDKDGYVDACAYYSSGVIQNYILSNQSGISDLGIIFSADGIPVFALVLVTGRGSQAQIRWERYPSVEQAVLDGETFQFRPADFQFAPITFVELGGSQNLAGLDFPVPSYQYMNITGRALISFCSSLSRPSAEIDGAVETFFMERGVLLRAVETLNGEQVSVTEFERGLPVIQRIDLDLDGRMETIRRFRRPPRDYFWSDQFDYRRLISSSESDWSGDGRHMTREVYRLDGSVVYEWDMDGSGVMNYSEQGNGNQ